MIDSDQINTFYRSEKVSFVVLFVSILLSSCNFDTKEVIGITNKTLPNGVHITIEKSTRETTSRGIFTNHQYTSSHHFTYDLSIEKDNIEWEGGSGEPKNIIFCKDTIYIYSLKKKSIRTEYIDSLTNTTKSNHHYEIHNCYEKHVDKRYFFKLRGDDYWSEISPERYSFIEEHCDEYPVPNDNELSI